jgi:cytochrome c5
MSDPHASEDSGLIKTPTQLIVVIVLAFVVPIAGIFTIIHFVMGGDRPRAADAVYSKAVLDRIKPVGGVPASAIEKGPSPLVPAPVAAAPAGDAAAAPAASNTSSATGANGKAVFDASCQACHATGVAGAPKLGDKAAWAPRLGAGATTLLASAIKGKNAMPPKGGNLSLSDADVKAAVDYMVSQAK